MKCGVAPQCAMALAVATNVRAGESEREELLHVYWGSGGWLDPEREHSTHQGPDRSVRVGESSAPMATQEVFHGGEQVEAELNFMIANQ